MEIEKILASNIVDTTSLKSFFANDKDALIQLIEVYISDTSPRINILENSLTQIDYSSIKSITHFLKSSFGLMGIKCLDEITTLEKEAENKQNESIIKEKLNYVIPTCRESIAEYARILSQLKSL